MPALSRKRRVQPEPEESAESSPEPATQRRRTSGADREEEAYGSDEDVPPDTSTNEAVKKMVRLALACEYQRRPIRRADVTEKVLGAAHSRQFKKVFGEAQIQLQTVFGMVMVELPARQAHSLREKRAQKGVTTKTVTSWVLCSTLPTEFHDPEILPPTAAPTSAEEGVYTSIYTLLVSLVMLSGGSLPEAKMERYLRRMGMEDNTPVIGYAKTEMLLKRLEKEGYLLKVKESTSAAGENDISWHVGPRGQIEVGENGVKGLASAVYGDLAADEETELQRKLDRSLSTNEKPPEKRDDANGLKTRRGRKKKTGPEGEDEEEEDDDED